MRKTGRMSDAFVKAINDLNEEAFQLLYGRWDPLEPERVADLLFSVFCPLVDRWRPGSAGGRPGGKREPGRGRRERGAHGRPAGLVVHRCSAMSQLAASFWIAGA